MMLVYFKDGSTATLNLDYYGMVKRDARVVKAVDLRRNLVLFDRTPKQEG